MIAKIRRVTAANLFAGIIAVCTTQSALAVEGGFDYYAPGVYGNITLAHFPEPGKLYYLNYLVYSEGKADVAVRSGKVRTDIEVSLWANVFVAAYLAETKILGANYFAAAAVPVEWVDVDSSIRVAGVGSQVTSDSDSGLGDISIIPFGLSWKSKDVDTIAWAGLWSWVRG